MKHNYNFVYKRLSFGPLLENEIEKMRILRNNNKECFVFNQEIDSISQLNWYQKYITDTNDIMFSIFDLSGNWLGVASVYQIDQKKKCCEFGRLMLDKTYTKEKGLGVDAVDGLFDFATHKLGLDQMSLEVFSNNMAALKTYERAGFQRTGKTEILIDGRELIYMVRKLEEERV